MIPINFGRIKSQLHMFRLIVTNQTAKSMATIIKQAAMQEQTRRCTKAETNHNVNNAKYEILYQNVVATTFIQRNQAHHNDAYR